MAELKKETKLVISFTDARSCLLVKAFMTASIAEDHTTPHSAFSINVAPSSPRRRRRLGHYDV
jgi:hypothetical protein